MPRLSLIDRLKMALSLGELAGIGALIGCIAYFTVYIICEWIWPADTIDIAEEFPSKDYALNPAKYGNHMFEVEKIETTRSPGNITSTNRTRFSIKR